MIDIDLIRTNPDQVRAGLNAKDVAIDLNLVTSLDEQRRALQTQLDTLRAKRNQLSVEDAKVEGAALKVKLKELEEELSGVAAKFTAIMHTIPNLPDPAAPVGTGERDNIEVRVQGVIPEFTFEAKDHLVLGTALDILDFERGAKVAGSGFYYLKNEGALLEIALIHYTLNFLREMGFALWTTPDLAREEYYLGTGYTPKGPEAQTYEIAGQGMGLIATAEVTLAALHSGEVLAKQDLPLRYAGYSHCFRQEAGAYGKYSKGLYRVHQFTKVEMFAFAAPSQSAQLHEEFLGVEEELWQSLGIPYRVLEMCTGDLGAQAARKFDLEAWMPGRGDWGEVTSTSNTTDYQARNLNIRFKEKEGKTEFAHTLNGTAVATSRALVAILENYQQADGSIRIPEVLVKYLGFDKITHPVTLKS